MNNKQYYEKALPLLKNHGYKPSMVSLITKNGKEYTGIQLYSSSIMMDNNLDFIKSLIGGMGFNVRGNKNTSTISIK